MYIGNDIMHKQSIEQYFAFGGWTVSIKLHNIQNVSYPVRQKLNKNQLRIHMRRFNKYRKIIGYKEGVCRSGADVGRDKAFYAGWFNYVGGKNVPYKGKLIFGSK